MVPESAVRVFLAQIQSISKAGGIPNAQEIAKELFGETWHESMVNVVAECKRRGLLSRADLDYTGIALSPTGEEYLASRP